MWQNEPHWHWRVRRRRMDGLPFGALYAWRPSLCLQHSQAPGPGPRPQHASYSSTSSLMVSLSAAFTSWIGVLLRLKEDIFTERPVMLLLCDWRRRVHPSHRLIYRAKDCDGLERVDCWPSLFGDLFIGHKSFSWHRKLWSYLRREGMKEYQDSCFNVSNRITDTGTLADSNPNRRPNLTACARSIAGPMKNHFEVFKYVGLFETELYIGAVGQRSLANKPPRSLEPIPLSQYKEMAEGGKSRSELSQHFFICGSRCLTIISLTASIGFQSARNPKDSLASSMLSW